VLLKISSLAEVLACAELAKMLNEWLVGWLVDWLAGWLAKRWLATTEGKGMSKV